MAYIHFQEKKTAATFVYLNHGNKTVLQTLHLREKQKKMAMSENSLNVPIIWVNFFLHYIKSSLSTPCNYVFPPAI